MSTREKVIILIGALALGFVGIIAVVLLSGSSKEVSTIFGRIDRPDVTSIIRLRINILAIDLLPFEQLPQTANVFKIPEREVSREDAIIMASKFGFKAQPRGKIILSWEQKNQSLDIDLSGNRLNFKNLKVKPLKGKLSTEKLAVTAKKYLKQKGLPTDNLEADTKNILLLGVRRDELGITTDSSEPVFLEIGFNQKLDEYNLFYPNPSEPVATVVMNNKGQVFTVSYNFTRINEVTIGTYPLIDISKITTVQLANFGALVAPGKGESTFDTKLLRDITVEEVSLGYLDDKKGFFVQPVYILRGFAAVGNEITAVVIYYPAVEERWLK